MDNQGSDSESTPPPSNDISVCVVVKWIILELTYCIVSKMQVEEGTAGLVLLNRKANDK